MRSKLIFHCSFIAVAAVTVCPAPAAAAQAPAQSTPPSQAQRPRPGQSITVTGQRSAIVTTADRISFNVSNDLQAQTGTVADALRNVPGVEVDLQGGVSLRGDPNVKILIDGRPSSVLSGDNRGDALLSMPAGQIERVEVITNPSAAMSPEGSAGVINLVTKRARQGTRAATGRLTLGGTDRYGLNLSTSQSTPGLTLSGEAGYRRFAGSGDATQLRSRLDPVSGATIDSRLDATMENVFSALTGKLAVDRDINKSDRLSAEANYRRFAIDMHRDDVFQSAVPGTSYDRRSDAELRNRGISGKLSWRHSFSSKGHELVADLQADKARFTRDIRALTDFDAAPDNFEHIRNTGDRTNYNPKLDYTRPIGDTDSLNVGYEGDYTATEFDSFGARGPADDALVVVPGLTNRFDYDQRIHALYGTYKFQRGKLDTQAGLRLEQAGLGIDQVTDGTSFSQHYFRAYPTLHLAYQLTKTQQLRGSFSRRIQRPSPQDLNPYTIYIDPLNLRRGNPNLQPEITDSFELGWQRRKGGSFYSLTGFYRRSSGGVTDVISDVGGGVFLTTRANLTKARRVGADAIANGKLSKTLTYNASGTLLWQEIDPAQGGLDKRSATTGSARGNLTWQPNKKDFFQLSASYGGKTLLPQGYRLSSPILNLGYRRAITDKLNLSVSGQDVLGTARQVIVFRSPTIRDRLVQRGNGRTILFSLAYNWGKQTGRKQDPGFDFQQPSGGDIAQ